MNLTNELAKERNRAAAEHTSPVGTYPPNGYGLRDMIGNVWEWTDDWYVTHASGIDNPGGCCREASIDPTSKHGSLPRKVVKGGSFPCAPSYCRRYRPAARLAQGIDTSTCHMGFRCLVRS
ncbi:SUMF1/EgtB/PvdO family nonheme iron enzyme [Cyanobium sp. Aljojuca 7A6]|nr:MULTISPECIES: SUMF1/EgtB/PvdO family nonheme iron enzyme [unclassified Cyanobium]MCP9833813.1 SUMF1/EgtB/PvdO family nonheme iron enzyme [Cyanobium sp. La Preciosa 7G6]MCP9936429.1 SUMF1/EgtB/PvdO family nonheme iron enzyme [Cyanobium sp. Aljojuca 7A6]